MRKIILDTETTGLDLLSDRIIEVGCVELIDDIPTGNKFHNYYGSNDIKISEAAEEVHGLSNEFLKSFAPFDDNASELLNFIKDDLIVIHNSAFDLTIINNALKRMNLNLIPEEQTLCTLVMARKLFPGSKVNLNALCRRFNISTKHREKHDAITDCFLLAQVYLELIGGKQRGLELEHKPLETNFETKIEVPKKTPVIELTEHEIKMHKKMLDTIPKNFWN